MISKITKSILFHISNEVIYTHVTSMEQPVLRSIPISSKEVLFSQVVDQLKVARRSSRERLLGQAVDQLEEAPEQFSERSLKSPHLLLVKPQSYC